MSTSTTNSVAAIEFIQDGMVVGLGSGRASERFIEALARRKLKIQCVATSLASAELATSLGLNVVKLDAVERIDVAVDGADEADPQLNLIKGYGHAHVREKIIASAARKFIVLIGPEEVEEKVVPVLGTRGHLPMEVLEFGMSVCRTQLRDMGIESQPLMRDSQLWLSDNGNPLLDCRVGPIADPADFERRIRAIPAVVGTGLFIGMADAIIIQRGDTVEILRRG